MKSPPDTTWPWRRRLLIGLFAIISCGTVLAASPAFPVTIAEDRQNFLRLKERFELLALRYSDPIALACLAVETTAEAWTLAAARLADDPAIQTHWRAKAAELDKSLSSSRDWDARHRRALKLYCEALSEVASKVAALRPEGRLHTELSAVLEQIDRDLAALARRTPDAYLEKEVLSRNLMSLADLIVRYSGPELDQPADLILDAIAEETRDLRRRKGLHYRARLAFIYTAQVQALTDLIFLLGPAAGPPLSRPLAEIRNTLDKAGADPRLPTTLSLAWTAQAQASLPLAYWLSSKPRADKSQHP